MFASTRNLTISSLARLITHLRVPLYRNGYALVLSSLATSGLGMVYWILAARNYTTEVIGLNSALMAAMTFLANVSQLNLMNALNRFIPSAGRAAGRLVVSAYLISAMIALATSLIFVFGVEVWSPTLSFLKSSPLVGLWFTLATMAWCTFVLQDSALTGLRQATWVPIENILFALAKIALLVGLVTLLPRYGVFASWTIPVVVLLLPVNVLIFRYLIPRHAQVTADHAEPLVAGHIARYVAGDYLSSLVWMGATNLLPIIITERAGATANAYFYLSWTIASSLYLVSRSMGISLVAEASMNQRKLDTYSYQMFVRTALLLAPMMAIMLLGAPYILLLFGHSYATEGATLLRLLCLTALPDLVTSLYIDRLRVQRRMAALLVVLTSLSVLLLTLSYILLRVYGIIGIGMAWLLTQSIVAMAIMLSQPRIAWLPRMNVLPLVRLLAVPRRLWWHWNQRRHMARASELIPVILPMISSPADTPPPSLWGIQRLVRTVNDVTVITLGPTNQPSVALLKLPHTDHAAKSLQRQIAVLGELHADARLGEWRALLPRLMAEDVAAGQRYLVEQMLPGQDARHILSDPAARARMQVAAAAAIGELHRRTNSPIMVDAAILEGWVDEPLQLIRSLEATRRHAASHEQALDRLASELYGALAGRRLCVSWIHGDFAPENILVTADGATVTGIVDWELAKPDGLPQLDLVQLFLATRMLVQGCELGDIICDLLEGGAGWTPHERSLLDAGHVVLSGDTFEMRAMILLCWLQHVAANLTKSTRYARHGWWITKNLEAVLQCVGI